MDASCADGQTLGLVRSLLTDVDCHVSAVTQAGYEAVAAPGSQIAMGLTAIMTIYVAIFGLRLLLGMAPLRIGDMTVMALKLGLVLTLMTSWPTYQHLVYETLFRGPEQIAVSVMGAIQPDNARLRGNPFDGLQWAYDQMQAAAAYFARISPANASPFTGGNAFAAFSLNISALLALLTTLGVILVAKIVLGLLLVMGPIFIALLLFENTRGLFEGWLRACLAFACVPLFATLALTVQLSLTERHLTALVAMVANRQTNLSEASATFILSLVSASVMASGLVAILLIATGLKFHWKSARVAPVTAPSLPVAPVANPVSPQASQSFQPRIATIHAAAAALERRDLKFEGEQAPRRLALGARAGSDEPAAARAAGTAYRRSAQPRRATSSSRRDR